MDQQAIKRAFLLNAAFSGLSGALGVALHGPLRAVFGAPSWLFPLLGAGLLGFALQLVVLARRAEVPKRDAIQVIASDALWVVACATLIALGIVSGPLAIGLTLGTCVPVGAFTILQVRATVARDPLRSP